MYEFILQEVRGTAQLTAQSRAHSIDQARQKNSGQCKNGLAEISFDSDASPSIALPAAQSAYSPRA